MNNQFFELNAHDRNKPRISAMASCSPQVRDYVAILVRVGFGVGSRWQLISDRCRWKIPAEIADNWDTSPNVKIGVRKGWGHIYDKPCQLVLALGLPVTQENQDNPDFIEAAFATGALGYVLKCSVSTDLPRNLVSPRRQALCFSCALLALTKA